LGFTRNLLKCNSNFEIFALQAAHCTSKLWHIDFLLNINVQTEIIGKK